MRKGAKYLRASVLPTVIVASALMLLVVLGLLSLWEADFLLFSRAAYGQQQRANIESVACIYRNYPDSVRGDSVVRLYDSLPSSRMQVSVRPWGLYEILSVASPCGTIHRTGIMGQAEAWSGKQGFWYSNAATVLTLTGNTNIKTDAAMPSAGFTYGQMQSVFFSGEMLSAVDISSSADTLPGPSPRAAGEVDRLLGMADSLTERWFEPVARRSFRESAPAVMWVGEGMLAECELEGYIIVAGEELHIDSSCRLSGIVVAARKVTVGDGFRGTVQVFASDSVTVGCDVALEYPSGVYSRLYAEIGAGSEVNGYVIVDFDGKKDVRRPNCRKDRLSRVRGLFYARGISVAQGIVTGAAFIDESVYYAPHGYYRNTLYDLSVLASEEAVYPVWLDGGVKRKEAAWVE